MLEYNDVLVTRGKVIQNKSDKEKKGLFFLINGKIVFARQNRTNNDEYQQSLTRETLVALQPAGPAIHYRLSLNFHCRGIR